MATITLYKDKLNGVGSLISTMVSSVNNLDMQLGALKSTLQVVNSSTYNLDSAVENIRSSSQTEQEKADDLKKLSKEVDNFITVTVNRDQAAKEEINKAKEDFYTKYSYLKPECEKDFIEKVVDTVESAADWCCDHWEVIAAIAAVIVVAVVVCVLLGPEALVPLVLNIAKGVLQGALLGGALGGAFSAFMGGDIVKGIKEGALAGGALGALGAVGSACGCIIGCESAFGIVSGSIGRLTGGIATAMFDFDIVSMIGYKIDGENNKIYQINKECHSNQIYNFFQRGITAIAAFTGGMSSAMKCFIAGTVIATETGFARIEDVKHGDIVLSTNIDTMETGYKKVLEKYVRKTRELVHIIVGGKEIVSTPDHPYYVEGRGFVNACQLCIGSPLLDSDGKILEIEQIYKEQLEKNEEVTVYNFQVEDWHTYHVGEMEVLVHNAEYESGAYSGDLMSTEEAARYSEHWRELGIGSDKTYNDFIMNNPGKNIDDYFRLVKEQSPWPDGYMPSEHMVTLKSGDTFNMVLDSKQKTSNPGGFALKEDVPSVEFARKDMAIKYGWKDDCGKVVTYRVKDGVELICPAGSIGPQIDLGVDMYLPGNSSLTQYDLFNGLGRINRTDFIEVVPGSIKRIK